MPDRDDRRTPAGPPEKLDPDPLPSGTPESSDAGPPYIKAPDGDPLKDRHRVDVPDLKPIRKPKKPEPDPGPAGGGIKTGSG